MYSKKRCMPRKVRSRKYKKSTKNRRVRVRVKKTRSRKNKNYRGGKEGQEAKPDQEAKRDFNPLKALNDDQNFKDLQNMAGRLRNVAKKAAGEFSDATQPTKRQRTKELNVEIKKEEEKLTKLQKTLKEHTDKETKVIEKQKGLVKGLKQELDMLNKSTIGPDEPISNIKPRIGMPNPKPATGMPKPKPVTGMMNNM